MPGALSAVVLVLAAVFLALFVKSRRQESEWSESYAEMRERARAADGSNKSREVEQ